MLTEQVGELARYSPEEPCAWCLGRISQKALSYELMSELERQERQRAAAAAVHRVKTTSPLIPLPIRCGEGIGNQYWGGTPPKELTVGYMTTAIGAIQAGYAEGWIMVASHMPHQRLQFDLGMPLLGVVPVAKPRRPECSCNRTKAWSDQARADRSVTKPAHWAEME